jgi:hypothetical protein
MKVIKVYGESETVDCFAIATQPEKLCFALPGALRSAVMIRMELFAPADPSRDENVFH